MDVAGIAMIRLAKNEGGKGLNGPGCYSGKGPRVGSVRGIVL